MLCWLLLLIALINKWVTEQNHNKDQNCQILARYSKILKKSSETWRMQYDRLPFPDTCAWFNSLCCKFFLHWKLSGLTIWFAALTNMSVNRSIIVVSHWVQWIVCGSGRCKSSSVAFKWDGGKIHYDQTLHLCAQIRVYTLIYRIEKPGIYWMSFYESITDN